MTTDNWSWSDAREAKTELRRRTAARSMLLLLARLPLLPEKTMEQLAGLQKGASLYRSLAFLQERQLIHSIRPPLRPGCSPQLFYLTNLGLATVALYREVDPRSLAHQNRIRGTDLLRLLPGLPYLVAQYELLGALAASQPGIPDLLAWERPWRRRYQRPTAKSPTHVTLPAYAALDWGDGAASFLLLPDLGGVSLRAFREKLRHLSLIRGITQGSLPELVIATSGEGRAAAWKHLLDDMARAHREPPLSASIATWSAVRAGYCHLLQQDSAALLPANAVLQRPRVRELKLRGWARPLPELAGSSLAAGSADPSAATGSGQILIEANATDRALIDLIARHSFLTLKSLTKVLRLREARVKNRVDRLVEWGLLRIPEPVEFDRNLEVPVMVEATAEGMRLAAAQQGLTLGEGVRHNGLVGGGPERPLGARAKLAQNLQHTLGADEIFVRLILTGRRLAANGSDDALVEWRSAAACSRNHFRPDGYGLYRHQGELYGFFLEYDRGTMSATDYLEKFAAYYRYITGGLFERDYERFPTMLVVTTKYGSEERIARALRAAGLGWGLALPVLLTSTDLIRQDADGILGPVWREPDTPDRRYWPLGSNRDFRRAVVRRV